MDFDIAERRERHSYSQNERIIFMAMTIGRALQRGIPKNLLPLVVNHKEFSHAEICILLFIGSFHKECHEHTSDMAEVFMVSEKTIKRVLKSLKDRNVIDFEVCRIPNKKSKWRSWLVRKNFENALYDKIKKQNRKRDEKLYEWDEKKCASPVSDFAKETAEKMFKEKEIEL
jgi:DNA-binding MarR family transcriptional regulator